MSHSAPRGAFNMVKELGLWLSDVTAGNASTAKHGLLPKLSGNAAQYLDGTGAFSTPAGGGSVTRRISVLNGSLAFDTTGECWAETYDVLATNDTFKHTIIRFGASNSAQPTVKHGFYGQFNLPHDFAGNLKIYPVWTATVTTGDVAWSFAYRAITGNDTESLDQSGFVETSTATDTAPGAANRRLEIALAPTSANFSADDAVTYYFTRDGTAGADTMAASAIMFDLLLEYTT